LASIDADPPAAKPRLTGVAAKAQEAVQAVASRRGDVVLLRDLAHQAQITEAFVARGLVLAANTVDELRAALQQARARERVLATTDPVQLQDYLRELLAR